MAQFFRDKPPPLHKSPQIITGEIADDIDQSQSQGSQYRLAPPALAVGAGEGSRYDEPNLRTSWYGNFEFLFVCLGYSLGLGHVWRFPSLIYKHEGGAFFVPYTVCLVLCALPMVYLELLLGQFTCVGPLHIWRILPIGKGIGYAMVLTCGLMVIYFSLLMPLSLNYFFGAMKSVLDFQHCNNSWNTNKCREVHTIGEYCGSNDTAIQQICANSSRPWKMPAKEYFNHMLQKSARIEDSGAPSWQLSLSLLLAYCLILIGVLRGIHNRGKVMYVTVLAPWLFLLILLVSNCLAEGSWRGVLFYLRADWARLGESKIWIDAAGQAFLSMGPSVGVYTTLASYNKFHYNVFKDAVYLVVANLLTSFIAGMVVFAAVGNLSMRINIGVSDLLEPGLMFIFVVYPESIATMRGAPLWALLTFLLLFLLSYSSHLAMTHSLHVAIFDQLPEQWQTWKTRVASAVGLCFVLFLAGLLFLSPSGLYWFELLDMCVPKNTLLLTAALAMLALAWGYSWKRLQNVIFTMMGVLPTPLWRVLWCGVSPLIILIIVACDWGSPWGLKFDSYIYATWSIVLGHVLAFMTLVPIPAHALYTIYRTWRHAEVAAITATSSLQILNNIVFMGKENSFTATRDLGREF